LPAWRAARARAGSSLLASHRALITRASSVRARSNARRAISPGAPRAAPPAAAALTCAIRAHRRTLAFARAGRRRLMLVTVFAPLSHAVELFFFFAACYMNI